MADVLHCEGHICSSLTDHSSLWQAGTPLVCLMNGKTRKGRRGIVAAGAFTEVINNLARKVSRHTSVDDVLLIKYT